jgi:hypothetical protein
LGISKAKIGNLEEERSRVGIKAHENFNCYKQRKLDNQK